MRGLTSARRSIAIVVILAVAGLIAAACSDDNNPGDEAVQTPGGEDIGTSGSTAPQAEPVDLGDLERIGPDDPLNQDPIAEGAERIRFTLGPVDIRPGQNNIDYSGPNAPHPDVPGWITRISTNIMRADGTVPPVDVIHLHHGVWVNLAEKDLTVPRLPERMYAAGEEKTIANFPEGYGYENNPEDPWLINYMIHNAFPTEEEIWIVYDLDFIPATAPEADGITAARPIWTDIANGSTYPVFDALDTGDTDGDGNFTFPTDDPDAEAAGTGRWTADKDYLLLGGGGHLHPGGLYVDLFLEREGASAAAGSEAAEAADGDRALLFRSEAVYYEPAGNVSWDVSMTTTPKDWRVEVKKGDVLDISTTYDVGTASWYESMGIFVILAAETGSELGTDPFEEKVAVDGDVTHGHLRENENHGGDAADYPDPRELPDGPQVDEIQISDFVYGSGDISEGDAESIPVVPVGETIRFDNSADAKKENGIWHSVTACEAPCTNATGIAFPLADGEERFDSGQLGTGGEPTANRVDWETPDDLDPGTYTYFCRIHPFMRGAFRVVEG